MAESEVYISLIPLPSTGERPDDYGELNVAWSGELRRLAQELRVCSNSVSVGVGRQYRWRPCSPSQGTVHKMAAKVARNRPDWLAEIIVLLSAPVVVTALFGVVRSWINARAGRRIRLKIGDVETEFKGLTEERVLQLLEKLQTLAREQRKEFDEVECDEDVMERLGRLEAAEKERVREIAEDVGITMKRLDELQVEELQELSGEGPQPGSENRRE